MGISLEELLKNTEQSPKGFSILMDLPVEFLEESLGSKRKKKLQDHGSTSEQLTGGTFGDLLQRSLEISK